MVFEFVVIYKQRNRGAKYSCIDVVASDMEEAREYVLRAYSHIVTEENIVKVVKLGRIKMKKLNVRVNCMAGYDSSIEVPEEMTLEEAIGYAKEHINEIPLGVMEYISDSDELDEENCDFDEE